MALSKDTLDFAMDLTATLAAEEIAERRHESQSDALADLLASDTGQRLYDDDEKLWWDGPSALADRFIRESSEA